MSITVPTLIPYLSNPAAGAGGVAPQPDPALSLGGYVSTTPLTCGAIGGIFGSTTGFLSAEGGTDYRCLFLVNTGGGIRDLEVWLVPVAGGANLTVGVDPTPASLTVGAIGPQALTVPGVMSAPAGVAFSEPTDLLRLLVGAVPSGHCVALWFSRDWLPMSPQMAGDGATISFAYRQSRAGAVAP